jgi:hypothetical protein
MFFVSLFFRPTIYCPAGVISQSGVLYTDPEETLAANKWIRGHMALAFATISNSLLNSLIPPGILPLPPGQPRAQQTLLWSWLAGRATNYTPEPGHDKVCFWLALSLLPELPSELHATQMPPKEVHQT